MVPEEYKDYKLAASCNQYGHHHESPQVRNSLNMHSNCCRSIAQGELLFAAWLCERRVAKQVNQHSGSCCKQQMHAIERSSCGSTSSSSSSEKQQQQQRQHAAIMLLTLEMAG